MEYINRENVIDLLLDWQGSCMTGAEEWHIRQVIGDIKSIFAADVVPVVRCKDCKYGKCKHQDVYLCDVNGEDCIDFHEPEFFCAYGQRRE